MRSKSTTVLVPKRHEDCGPGEDSMSLLALCEALHMAKTGAADGLDQSVLDRSLAGLRDRLKNWLPSPSFTARYDNAVRALIVATLQEWE